VPATFDAFFFSRAPIVLCYSPGNKPSGAALISDDLVTISVTAFERADLLETCLRSLVGQTYSELEIRIFDNSRSDDVRRLVHDIGDCRIVYERNPPNAAEIVVNHQKAFVPGRGKYHMVLSSDWALRADAIETMVARLERDPSICLVVADGMRRFPDTGLETKREPMFVSYGGPGCDTIDGRWFVEGAFWKLRGVGIVYHALIAADVFRYANIQKVYLNQGYEHQAGLELALIKPRFGIVREPLFIELVNSRRFSEEKYRNFSRLSEAVARARFLEKNYLDLLSRGFDLAKLRLGLCILFLRCAFRVNENAFEALYFAARYGAPALAAGLGLAFVLPARAVRSAIRRVANRRPSRTPNDPNRRLGAHAQGVEPAAPASVRNDRIPFDVDSVRQH
jgi:hypothetical protein